MLMGKRASPPERSDAYSILGIFRVRVYGIASIPDD